jgi:TRAP-type uncharacterized transport system substrate-binding protein
MKYLTFAIAAGISFALIAPVSAQNKPVRTAVKQPVKKAVTPRPPLPQGHANRRYQVNAGTVRIIADTIGSTHSRMAADMQAVFDRGNKLRILPILGRGAEQAITDILYLKGIDFGIVQSDVLSYIRQQGTFLDIQNRIHYITKLHNQEFHVIARKEFKSLADLAGRKINFGIKGSGAYITASAVFKAHNIQVKPVAFDEMNALDKIRLGEIAAMVYVAGKPAPLFKHIAPDSNLHLVPTPYLANMKDYLPAKFTSNDYPGLVAPSGQVETIAVRAVLAVFNWRRGTTRYNKMVNLISTLFTNFHELRKPPRHPKWREVNIHAKVPGWNRFPPATEWVARNAAQVAERRAKFKAKKVALARKRQFRSFVKQQRLTGGGPQLTRVQMNQLFEQFLRWRKSSGRAQ